MMVIIPLLIKNDTCKCFDLKSRLGETVLLQSEALRLPVDIEKIFSDIEKVKLDRLYRNKKRQQQLILGRLMIRQLIIQNNNLEEDFDLQRIQILNEDDGIKGSPFFLIDGVKNGDDISISYTTDYVCVGYGKKCKIGVDIEKIFNIENIKHLKTIFSQNEWEDIFRNVINKKQLKERMTLKWCVKEAILKAAGIGFKQGFKSIEVYYSKKEKCHVIRGTDGILDPQKKYLLHYSYNDDLCQIICFIV
jgi:4'-phosphopantetheinyl transferase family protein